MTGQPDRRPPRRRGERWDFARKEWVTGDASEEVSMGAGVNAQVFALPGQSSNNGSQSMPLDPEAGPVEAQARKDIAVFVSLSGLEATLAESIYALARGIDTITGDTGASLSAMSGAAKELRASMDRLAELVGARTAKGDPRLEGLDVPR